MRIVVNLCMFDYIARCVFVHVRMCAWMCVCVRVFLYDCVRACTVHRRAAGANIVHAYMCMYTYIHTHTHTFICVYIYTRTVHVRAAGTGCRIAAVRPKGHFGRSQTQRNLQHSGGGGGGVVGRRHVGWRLFMCGFRNCNVVAAHFESCVNLHLDSRFVWVMHYYV